MAVIIWGMTVVVIREEDGSDYLGHDGSDLSQANNGSDYEDDGSDYQRYGGSHYQGYDSSDEV